MRILKRLFERQNVSADIDKELKFHIDERADYYVASGLSRSDARRQARAEFGGVQQIKEQVREVWILRWWEDARRDTAFALRTYVRAPVFAVTAVLTLALGLGVNTALFSIVREVLLARLPVPNADELVQIECNAQPGRAGGGSTCMHSYPAFQLLSQRHDGLSSIAAFSPVPNGVIASFRGRREVITGQLASATMFDVLSLVPTEGRLLQEADDRPGAEAVAVLNYGYWQRAFGGARDVIGQSLALNNQMVTIVGVLPSTFRGVTFGEAYDVVLPLGRADMFRTAPPSQPAGASSILHAANMGWLTFLGRRQSGNSDREVAQRLEPVFRQSVESMLAPIPSEIRKKLNLSADDIRVSVSPAAFGAQSNLRRGLEPTLRVLLVVVVLILLITCANLAGLLLAKALNRQREFGLRVALGASTSRLFRQLLTETLLLATIGGGLGLLLALWIAPAGLQLATDDTILRAVDLTPDRLTLGFTALLSGFAALMVGLGAMLRPSRATPQDALRNRGSHGSTPLTKVLLAAQVALTVALVGSAALLLQTLTNLRHIDVGFQPQKLVTITMDAGVGALGPRTPEYVERASTALARLPGVADVTYSNVAFASGVPINFMLDVPGFEGSGPNAASSGVISAGPRFVRTLGLTLIAGRDFLPADRAGSSPVAVVNESFATAFFANADVVGRTFALRGPGNQPIAIVGVVKDARDRGIKRPTQPVIYVPFGQREVNTVTFTVRAQTRASSLSETVRRTLESLDSSVGILRMRTVDAQIDDVLRRERLLATLGTVFGGLALLLVAIGVFGMLNGIVVRRTTEIGVRMALGASRRGIAWMLARETVILLIVGLSIGVAGHLLAGRLIQSELFGVGPSDLYAAAAAVVSLLVISTVAVWAPARRATRIDPAEALRYDDA